jgi:hypothetical protein
MTEALLRVSLEKVEFEDFGSGCHNWNGLIECGVEPNGTYVGMVPFSNVQFPPQTVPPSVLSVIINPMVIVYDGVGGFCDSPPDAKIFLQVSASGLDQAGLIINGTGYIGDTNNPNLFTHSALKPTGVHTTTRYYVEVDIPSPPLRRRARLWFHFIAENFC